MTKMKNGVKTVSLSDFLEFDLEICPKYLTLSKILTGIEIMLNIMVCVTENKQVIKIHGILVIKGVKLLEKKNK